MADEDEGVLPIHLACIFGSKEETIYMQLLTLYPEGSMVRDDFGRLPIDYAKSIRSDSHRRVAVECLKRAKWLEIAAKDAKERTESDFYQRIKGYEESQAQHLKMLENVHTKEISDLEESLKSKQSQVAERSQEMKEMDQHLQEITDRFRERIEFLEKSMDTKTRKLQGQIDKAKEDSKKNKKALDTKIVEANKLSLKVEKTKALNDSLSQQLEQRTEELDLALEDIETLNKHSEWLESVLESIRNLSNSESPQILNSRKNGDMASITSTKSKKSSSRTTSRRLSARNVSPMVSDETREPASFVSRILGSRRE